MGRLHVKIAKDRGRGLRLVGIGLAILGMTGTRPAGAQQAGPSRYEIPPPVSRTDGAQPRQPTKPVDLRTLQVPGVQMKAIPVNPSDPICLVNGQVLTRQQLADEAVARKGKEVLDTMINRVLIEQALARQKITVTAADIDEEIEAIAARFGIDRQGWLRTLDKERGISPSQYAREIVYPAIALRKLCADQVQVTPKDLQDAFEAQYGEKLQVRMILVDKQFKAMQIWEELHKNSGAFESVAKAQSMDHGSASLGGLIAEPITRHSFPRNLSDSAFQQLVDGDPRDRDPTHKPKDGDITGPIQIDQGGWVLLRRESLIPADKGISLRDEHIRKNVYEVIYQVKLKEEMERLFHGLIKAAAIENRLTGAIKMANEERDPAYRVDGDVKLMGGDKNGGGGAAPAGRPAPAAAPSATPRIPPPAALSPEASQQFRPLKPGGNPTAPAAQPAGGSQ